jgi:hypothetical protein
VERIYTINYLSDSAVKIRMEKDMWSQIVYNGRTNDIVWLDVDHINTDPSFSSFIIISFNFPISF